MMETYTGGSEAGVCREEGDARAKALCLKTKTSCAELHRAVELSWDDMGLTADSTKGPIKQCAGTLRAKGHVQICAADAKLLEALEVDCIDESEVHLHHVEVRGLGASGSADSARP